MARGIITGMNREITMENKLVCKPSNRSKKMIRPIAFFTAVFALAFLLASCAGPRYGGYGGGHHYMNQKPAGEYYHGSR
jgi:hypothetical protein